MNIFLEANIFHREASLWNGDQPYEPVWSGNCPVKGPGSNNPHDYVANVINLGSKHYEESHYSQTRECILEGIRVGELYFDEDDRMEGILKTARINLNHINAAGKQYRQLIHQGVRGKPSYLKNVPIKPEQLDDMYMMNSKVEEQREIEAAFSKKVENKKSTKKKTKKSKKSSTEL